MKCPACGYFMDAMDKECPRCHGKGLPDSTAQAAPSTPQAAPEPASAIKAGSGTSAQRLIGVVLMTLGLAAAAYFNFMFDVSVAVPSMDIMGTTVGGGRVNNIGLMAERQNGILMGIGAAILGAVLYVTGKPKE